MKNIFFAFLCLLNSTLLQAAPESSPWFSEGVDSTVMIKLDVYMASTCPHCHKADAYFKKLEKKEPWLIINRHVIDQDKAALESFYQQLHQQQLNNFAVPAFFFCDSHWVGFSDEANTGETLLRALRYCQQQIQTQHTLSKATIEVLRQRGSATQLQVNPTVVQSPVQFIALTALMDALNPCALFALATFLAFLWFYPATTLQPLAAGLLFIATFCVMHLIQQLQPQAYYRIFPTVSLIAPFIGLCVLGYVFTIARRHWLNKPFNRFTWGMVLIPFMGVVVYLFQQRCPFNAAVVFEQWLVAQSPTSMEALLYRVMYQAFYLMPSLLLLCLYVVLGRCSFILRRAYALRISAGVILFFVGCALVLYPNALMAFSWSCVVLMGSLLMGFVLSYWRLDHTK